MASQCFSEFVQSWSPIASPNSLDHCLQLHLHTSSITASQCISDFTQPRCPIASRNLLNQRPEVHLQPCSIMAFQCISKFTHSWSPIASPVLHNHSLHIHPQRVIESVYLEDPGVDRYHVFLISSYHSMKIQSIVPNLWSHS
jgi:hypothetical protein